jgi:hypothetical protein
MTEVEDFKNAINVFEEVKEPLKYNISNCVMVKHTKNVRGIDENRNQFVMVKASMEFANGDKQETITVIHQYKYDCWYTYYDMDPKIKILMSPCVGGSLQPRQLCGSLQPRQFCGSLQPKQFEFLTELFTEGHVDLSGKSIEEIDELGFNCPCRQPIRVDLCR